MLDNVKHSCRPQRITYQLIHRSANLHQGESVLIHGAAGGAGTARAATRLARQVENVRHRIQAQARSGGCSRRQRRRRSRRIMCGPGSAGQPAYFISVIQNRYHSIHNKYGNLETNPPESTCLRSAPLRCPTKRNRFQRWRIKGAIPGSIISL